MKNFFLGVWVASIICICSINFDKLNYSDIYELRLKNDELINKNNALILTLQASEQLIYELYNQLILYKYSAEQSINDFIKITGVDPFKIENKEND